MKSTPELIVVGAGTSGIPAACAAAENGAQVTVFEKDDRLGGTLWVTGAHLSGAGTRRQKQKGIADSPESHFADAMRISNGTVRADLLWHALTEAPRTIDWLEDQGFEFDPACPRVIYGHEPYSTARTYYGTDGGRSVLDTLMPIWEEHVSAGRIQVHLNSRVTDLLYSDGVVWGVRARTQHGQELEVRGDSVVLATGGYGASRALIARLHPEVDALAASHETSTGDGLCLAEAVGAQLAGRESFLPTFGGLEDPARPGFGVDFMEHSILFVPQYRLPWEIYVDLEGRRFMPEDHPSIDLRERRLMDLPRQRFWLVFDEEARQRMDPLAVGWSSEELGRMAEDTGTPLYARDTLEELALRAGVSPEGLTKTVREYNQAVDEGRDPFGRTHLPASISTPPYFAFALRACVILGFAGADVDVHLRVRHRDGTIIPGLYAIGEVLGAAALSGNSFLSGMSVGPCISFGRELGTALAQGRLPWEDS